MSQPHLKKKLQINVKKTGSNKQPYITPEGVQQNGRKYLG